MTLDRTTYEAWLLDRIEGNLTPEQEFELNAFLAANPDLPVSGDDLPSVPGEAPGFAAKELLRKHFPPTGAPDAARLTDFLIARLEGTLSAEQEQQLDRYFYEDPEAAREAKLVAATRSVAMPETFGEKASIERHFPPHGLPDKHRLTDFLIAAREGDLTAEQRTALTAYVQAHPEVRREERLVAAAYVAPERVVYQGKERLKKREGRVVPLWTRLAAAASVVLVLGLGWWLLRGEHGEEQPIARQEKTVVPAVPKPRPVQPAMEHDQPGSSAESGPGTEYPARPSAAPATNASVKPGAPVQEHIPAARPEEGARPTRPAVQPVPEPSDAPEPSLAQVPRPAPVPSPVVPAPSGANEPVLAQAAQAPAHEGGTPLATFVANTVRDGVLDEPQRNTALDGNDAVAVVDKGLQAITGGTGGMQVERTGARQRIKLQLGRHFAISADRGR